ncbi:hypothetical protein [Flavobacterium facile]|uniref:hypothetical protein n=1 Tax=Flavobacterium facile TaxID=2893174 RepID=UPI002E77CFC0|nr:hypothetical protein [Flavobacterium sp. T-12]
MKWKFMGKTVAFLLTMFNLTDLPINAEKKEMELTPEQEAQAKAALGEDYENVRAAINKELETFASTNFDLKAIQDELAAARQALALEEEENAPGTGAEEPEAANSPLHEQISAINKKWEAKFKALVGEGVGDTGKVIKLNGGKQMKQHSSTHLHASGFEFDAFEGRSWNKRAAGLTAGVSNFNDKVDIPLLQGDIEHFVRKNPTVLESIFDDFEGLPKDWGTQSGIIDRVINGLIAPSEITQGDNGGWNPKGEVVIETEEGRVYDKKIDITLTGEKLKQIEKSWITFMNGNDGSHPWKTTFVGFLLGEYFKQAVLDSRIAMVNGIFVKTPKELTGMNVNSQNGLRSLWYYYRDIEKKYKAFDIGEPTKENIVDYVKTMIEMIPLNKRNQQGWEIQMSTDMLLWYKERAGEFYALHYATDQGKSNYTGVSPLNYPNFKFQPLVDQTDTLFIGITKSKNVETLYYRENEKGELTVTRDKRDTNMFADFKEGIRFVQVGRKYTAGEPKEFEFQMVYSNSVPVFSSETRIPLFDPKSTTISFKFPFFYPHLEIVQNDYGQDIVNITGVVPGQIVTITGLETLSAARKVKNNANLILGADFELNTGGTLTLVVQQDLKLKKLSATTGPAAPAETDKTFTTNSIDVKGTSVFRYGGAASATLATILNGVDGKSITIYGTDAAGVDFTVADVAGLVEVASNAVLGAAANYITLTRVNGIWYETSRLIA